MIFASTIQEKLEFDRHGSVLPIGRSDGELEHVSILNYIFVDDRIGITMKIDSASSRQSHVLRTIVSRHAHLLLLLLLLMWLHLLLLLLIPHGLFKMQRIGLKEFRQWLLLLLLNVV